MDSFNIFEVNVRSMQKGEEVLRIPAGKRLELAEILAPTLAHLAPGQALMIYRSDYDT